MHAWRAERSLSYAFTRTWRTAPSRYSPRVTCSGLWMDGSDSAIGGASKDQRISTGEVSATSAALAVPAYSNGASFEARQNAWMLRLGSTRFCTLGQPR